MQNKKLLNRLNDAIQNGEYQLFLPPHDHVRYQYLKQHLPASYHRQLRAAFYVFRDEEMIATLYQVAATCTKAVHSLNLKP